MTKTEWALLIGVVIFIDIVQILITLVGIGLFINRFSNIAIGILLPFYLSTRGVKMLDPKKMIAMFGAFAGEFFVIGDFLPLWTLVTVLTYILHKGEQSPESVLGRATKVVRVIDRATSIKKPLNKDGVRLPQKPDTI